LDEGREKIFWSNSSSAQKRELQKPTMLSITCRTKCLLPSIKPVLPDEKLIAEELNDHAHSLKNGV
jgi:hypothetical protein